MEDNSNEIALAFIKYVVENLVEEPEKVSLEQKIDDLGLLILLKVAKNDMGKIIGKNGQTIKALRILLHTFGSKYKMRVNLKVEEPLT